MSPDKASSPDGVNVGFYQIKIGLLLVTMQLKVFLTFLIMGLMLQTLIVLLLCLSLREKMFVLPKIFV